MTGAEEEYAAIYGPAARHCDHQVGQVISYHDAGQASGKNSGSVLYVAAATDREPLRYIVSPVVGVFPVEVLANEIIIE